WSRTRHPARGRRWEAGRRCSSRWRSCWRSSRSASPSSTARRPGSRRICERHGADRHPPRPRGRERAPARPRERARERARRGPGAHERRRRAVAGAGVLAGPLAPRPERADATPRRERVPGPDPRPALGRVGGQAGPAPAQEPVSGVSVVIPVKDGARYLEELLDALERERPDEVLVVDSGSRDGSPGIARAHGVELLEIEPGDFSHGRTRNLAAERTSGELICFLTQDATPCPGWLAAYREAFTLADDVGAAYGPHLARPDTSPMIARELAEFFAGFATDGGPTVQRRGDATFLSNVNACYARACWEQIRFRDVPYSEDQAFGEDLLAAGWSKVYQPAAAVLHAHDYPPVEFMRRYFDEYRGLREAKGHVEPFALASSAGHVRRAVGADRRWLRERGVGGSELARWTARA